MIRRPIAVVALLSFGAAAHAGEPRRLVVTPGLVLEGEVVETTGAGFVVEIAQGRYAVGYDVLEDLIELDSVADISPPTFTMVIANGDPEAAALLQQVMSTVPGVEALTGDGWDALHPGADAAACRDLRCLTEVLAADPGQPDWVFAASASLDESGLVASSTLAIAPETARATASFEDDARVWSDLARRLVGLEADGGGVEALDAMLVARQAAPAAAPVLVTPEPPPEPVVVTPEPPPEPVVVAPEPPPEPVVVAPEPPSGTPGRRTITPGRVAALSFVPFPGVPSLVQKDYAGFAGALFTTAALTTGWVFTSGATTTGRGEQIALSAVGAWVSSVASSNLFGQLRARRDQPVLAVTPTFGDGRIDGAALSVVILPRTR